MRGRVFEEFQAERRLEGTAVMLSLTVSLSMNLPSGRRVKASNGERDRMGAIPPCRA